MADAASTRWSPATRWSAYAGGAAGFLTALLTVLCWVMVFALVWGPSLVGFGVAVTLPPAVVAGVALMYARRRFGALPDEPGR